MMQISVKLLATYRKKLPPGTRGSTCQIEVLPHSVVRQIVVQFDIAWDKSNVILLNGRVCDPDQKLENGDVVCIFPALAGG